MKLSPPGGVCRIALCALCIFASIAQAAETRWNSDSSGTFTTPANWDNGVPDADDEAVFIRPGASYTVTFPGSLPIVGGTHYVNDQLFVGANTVSFARTQLATYTLTHAFTTDADLGIIVQGISGNASVLNLGLALNTEAAAIALVPGSQGTLNVNGHNFNVNGSQGLLDELIVGNLGAGTLNVTGGGQVNLLGEFGNFVLGKHTGSSGVVTIDGEGTSFSSNRYINVVGKAGFGSLAVTGGGDIITESTIIGDLAGSTGIVAIDGPGSTWTNTESISVGSSGTGSLAITGGGHVTAGDGVIGDTDNVVVSRTGSVSVDGVGSQLTAENILFAGLGPGTGSGTAMVNVTNGGQLISSGGSIGQTGADGMVLIDGSGSKWTMSFDLNVGLGSNGNGVLDIKAGGQVSNGNAGIGQLSASGMVTVDGSNSKWTNRGGLNLTNGVVQITFAGLLTSNMSSIGGQFSGGATALVHVHGVGSTWSNADTQFVNLNGMLKITGGGQVRSTHAHMDRGTVDVEGAGSLWTLSGDLIVESGTLMVSNGGAVSVAGILSVESNSFQQGTVKGNGEIVATIINRGVVAPGNSVGALHIEGNLIQAATGTLQIELGGTTPGAGYDQLLVSGLAHLAGTLEVTTIDMFTPQEGNVFDILDWGSLSGTFSSIALPSLTAGLRWDTSQLYTTGMVSVVPALPGDFNGNGAVENADLTLLLNNWGEPVPPAPAGWVGIPLTPPAIDNAELTALLNHWGDVAGVGNNGSVPAPEPMTLGFACLAMIPVLSLRRQCIQNQ